MNADQAAALRKPFDKALIGQLPKGGVMLSFVGHAATTDRLLQVDPDWTWEPVAFTEQGLPRLDEHGGLWIRLTVCGVTRLGYGDSSGKKGPNAVKEAIGDAIRNASMRFGVAIDLWAKEDLTAVQTGDELASRRPAATQSPAAPSGGGTDLQSVRARVWLAAQARGMNRDDMAADFAATHGNSSVTDADVDQLTAYAVTLEMAS